MALNDNQRKIVEGIRRTQRIEIVAEDIHHTITVALKGKDAAHDIAIAVQKYFNELNKQETYGNQHKPLSIG